MRRGDEFMTRSFGTRVQLFRAPPGNELLRCAVRLRGQALSISINISTTGYARGTMRG